MFEDLSRRRRRSSEDHITGLPDELLHEILARLGSATAAARTSVLSRRWRHLWTHLPDLVLDDDGTVPIAPPPATFLETVDAALAGYSGPTLERLVISTSRDHGVPIPLRRVARWLRSAAGRVAGELCIHIRRQRRYWEVDCEVDLPTCERARSIVLFLPDHWKLRLPAAGSFAAVTSMTLRCGWMSGSELTTFVTTRSPSLRELNLCTKLVALCDVSYSSLRSDSLQSLWFNVRNVKELEVVAPRLELLVV
nr:unnamed protein product [Digitaria exilis]